ncbi:MAG: glycosyltransferase family 2 protein [Thermosynechococcaceae cyanobacterium MS004]|nr:glycosyltransferase family 2 protein [Thermosynechococcaceae cyanobacterium MS004]
MILWLLGLLDSGVLGLSLLLLLEILAARQSSPLPVAPNPSRQARLSQARSRLAVLVPAHNEASDIAQTLECLLPQINAGDRLVVIADNCTDCTAEVAQLAGAEVFVRENEALRGKGYALDYGLKRLASDPPEVVVIVDADCEVSQGSLDSLAIAVQRNGRPAQSTYLMHPPNAPTLRDEISGFALTLKNLVRPLGMKALGWPCLLTGSGMAFPWGLLQTVDLAGNKTVDDMQLTIDFTLQGAAPYYVPESMVQGRLMQRGAATSQRSRWEHGHLEMILTQVPRLLWVGLTQLRRDVLILGLDLAIPPLSLFILGWLLLVGAHLGLYLVSHIVPQLFAPELFGSELFGSELFALELSAGLAIGLSVGLGWYKFGREVLPIQSMGGIPQYLLWKLPIYGRFLIKPQTRWLKTERDEDRAE